MLIFMHNKCKDSGSQSCLCDENVNEYWVIVHTDLTCRLLPWRVLSRLVTPPSNPPLMKMPLLKWYSRMTRKAFRSPVIDDKRDFHNEQAGQRSQILGTFLSFFPQSFNQYEEAQRFPEFQKVDACVLVPTFKQLKILFSEALEGFISRCKDGVGALLLEQISQTGYLHQ